MGDGVSPLNEALKYLTHPIWVPNRTLKLNIDKSEPLIFSARSNPPHFCKEHHNLSSLVRSKLSCHLWFLQYLTANPSLSLVCSVSKMFHEPTNFTTSTATTLILTTISRGVGTKSTDFDMLGLRGQSDTQNHDKFDDSGVQKAWIPLVFKATRLHVIFTHFLS